MATIVRENVIQKAVLTVAFQIGKMDLVANDNWRLPTLLPIDLDPLTGNGLIRLTDLLVTAPHLKTGCPRAFRRRSDAVKVLVDSGGYQLIGGKIVYSPELRARLFHRSLRYPYAIILDAPTGAISNPGSAFYSYQQCLTFTEENARFVVENSGGAHTEFLNVIQGRSEWEALTWYDALKSYNNAALWGSTALRGVAFAGATRLHFSIVLQIIFSMLDEGLLNPTDRLHFLGTSHPEVACILTVIQDCLREILGEAITISFDSATSFLLAGVYREAYGYPVMNRDELRVPCARLPFDECFVGSDLPLPISSPVADRLTLGDLNHKRGPTPWDGVSDVCIAMHNVWMMSHSIDLAVSRLRMGRGWSSYWLPDHILVMAEIIREAFRQTNRVDFLKANARDLDQLAKKGRSTKLLNVFYQAR
jgi:hypothetical protein